MSKEIVQLAKQLIAIPSTEKNQDALQEVLDLAVAQLSDFTVERFERNGVKSILVYAGETRPDRFGVLLNGHLDVIPGRAEEYEPRLEGDKLYGVGSMDMKANVACIIAVFKEMVHQVSYPLGLQLVTDEEVGGFHGTKYQVEQGVRADFVIAAEPTNFDIVNQAKGILWAKVVATGKTAHGAYPWRGDNAIIKMQQCIAALMQRFPTPAQEKWVTTVDVSSIATTNDAFNKVPQDCTAELDVRFVPEDEDSVVQAIESTLPNGCTLEVVAKEPALNTNAGNGYITSLTAAVKNTVQSPIMLRGANGSSDARHFGMVGCPGVEFGPVGGNIGADDEWVSISSLQQYVAVLKEFLASV